MLNTETTSLVRLELLLVVVVFRGHNKRAGDQCHLPGVLPANKASIWKENFRRLLAVRATDSSFNQQGHHRLYFSTWTHLMLPKFGFDTRSSNTCKHKRERGRADIYFTRIRVALEGEKDYSTLWTLVCQVSSTRASRSFMLTVVRFVAGVILFFREGERNHARNSCHE